MGLFKFEPAQDMWNCPSCDRRVPKGFACPVCRRTLEEITNQNGQVLVTQQSAAAAEVKQAVVITGVKVPFWDLVQLLVNLALASIPAIIILTIITIFVVRVIGGLLGRP